MATLRWNGGWSVKLFTALKCGVYKYPLVHVYVTNWKITMLFMAKSTKSANFLWPFSIAMPTISQWKTGPPVAPPKWMEDKSQHMGMLSMLPRARKVVEQKKWGWFLRIFTFYDILWLKLLWLLTVIIHILCLNFATLICSCNLCRHSWMTRNPSNNFLVGGAITILKNMKVNGKDDIPCMKWKIKVMFQTTN